MPESLTPYAELAKVLTEMPTAVRVARRMRGLSLRAVAAATGVSFNTIARLEDGQNIYSMDAAIRLLYWLDDSGTKAP